MTYTAPTPADLAYAHRTATDPHHDARVQVARDGKVCQCGHLNVSHGYGHDSGPTWPDGSRIGRGACGVDRDPLNVASGWLGDRCPCVEFREVS